MKNGGSTDSRRTACASAGRAVRPFQRHDFAPCFAVRSVGPCGLCLQNVLHTVSPLLGVFGPVFPGCHHFVRLYWVEGQRFTRFSHPVRTASAVGVSASFGGAHTPAAVGFLAPIACRSGLQRMNENPRPSRSPAGANASDARGRAPQDRPAPVGAVEDWGHAAALAGSASAGMVMCNRNLRSVSMPGFFVSPRWIL